VDWEVGVLISYETKGLIGDAPGSMLLARPEVEVDDKC
jgi:hypothetical protein